ncbi:MAG: cupin domain-containing protein [Chlorobiaceae bacterium]|nr:cupin domain-containing protein [Chlorobiaceae bacterium]NTW10057.1 cupin domain-containing protein [Chlorobiaceae bacterium]
MQKADFWIERLQLQAHPEGGYYRETYRSPETLDFSGPGPFSGPRCPATVIYYLLKAGQRSRLHRIRSDEHWFFHDGSALTVYMFPENGDPSAFTLGLSCENGHTLQGTVPAGCWFGASIENPGQESYALVSCVVAPGFEFSDLTFAPKKELLGKFPEHGTIIEMLT